MQYSLQYATCVGTDYIDTTLDVFLKKETFLGSCFGNYLYESAIVEWEFIDNDDSAYMF